MKTIKKTDWKSLQKFLLNSEHPLDVIILCALETGARVSEVVGVHKDWIEDGCLRICSLKGSKPRLVPISKELQSKIKSYTEGDVFLSHSKKVKFENRRRILDKRLKWVCCHLFIKPVSMHTLRHTLCSELYRATKDIFMVKDFIGHRSVQSTFMYQHYNQKKEAENIVQGLLA